MSVSVEMLESVNRMQESIQISLSKAEKDNGAIYLQRVPNFGDVPTSEGAPMVKATPPTCLQPIASVSSARGPEKERFTIHNNILN